MRLTVESQQPASVNPSLPEAIIQAQKSRTLITGKVTAVEKNGFTVVVNGVQAFCPLQKMADGFIHIKNAFVGKEMSFIVEQTKGGVPQLSRIAAIKIENARLLDSMASDWKKVDPVLEGEVVRLADFGAFIDVGGLEGLIPISELSWAHTEKTSDAVKVGDKVKVKIIRWEKKDGRHKVSFSRRVLLPNPWDSVDENRFRPDARITGTVSRLTPAGAVIAFDAGIEGLLSPQDMSWEEASVDPAQSMTVGATVEVLVVRFDRRRRQLNLSLKFPEQDPWRDLEARLTGKESHTAKVLTLSSAGANVQIEPGIEGFLPVKLLQRAFESAYRKKASPGADIDVTVKKIDRRTRSLILSLPQLATGDEDDIHFREYEKERRARESGQSGEKLGSLGALLQARLSDRK
jgi:small subunit ribosomal protein S1